MYPRSRRGARDGQQLRPGPDPLLWVLRAESQQPLVTAAGPAALALLLVGVGTGFPPLGCRECRDSWATLERTWQLQSPPFLRCCAHSRFPSTMPLTFQRSTPASPDLHVLPVLPVLPIGAAPGHCRLPRPQPPPCGPHCPPPTPAPRPPPLSLRGSSYLRPWGF